MIRAIFALKVELYCKVNFGTRKVVCQLQDDLPNAESEHPLM